MKITCRIRLFVLVFGPGFGCGVPSYAQGMAATPQTTQQTETAAPLCDPNVIDGRFLFADQPAGEQTVSLIFQNKSASACRLHGEPGPSFGVDGHSVRVESCWLCGKDGKPAPAPERVPENEIVVKPGERAAVDLHWESSGASCQWADDVDFFVRWAKQTGYLFTPFQWRMHLCSEIRSSGYRPAADAALLGMMKEGALRIAELENPVYSDERATLHIAMQEGSNARAVGCQDIYTVKHLEGGMTRLDPLRTAQSSELVKLASGETQPEAEGRFIPFGYRLRCKTAGETTTAEAVVPAEDLDKITHIEWRAFSGKDPVFLTTETHFKVLDPETLAPNWGDKVEGIRTGLSIDRTTFKQGESIPLHLRWEDVDAPVPLAQSECGEPWPQLEILDSEHHLLRTFPMELLCMGHGWGPFVIEKGKAQRGFSEVAFASSSGWAPPRIDLSTDQLPVGVYFFMSVWSPHVFVADPKDEILPRRGLAGHEGEVYATVRSRPVRVEIVARSHP